MKQILCQMPLLILAACNQPEQRQVEIEAAEFRYSPASLEIEAGVPVHLVMRNEGQLLHDFNVAIAKVRPLSNHADHGALHEHHAPAGIHMAAQPGEMGHIAFIADAPGRYEIYCAVPGHREAGMRAELIVREKKSGAL